MKKNMIYILLILLLLMAPFIVAKQGEFGGADQEAITIVKEIQPDYQPIAQSVFQPASAEIESMLFVIQGVIGACFIGYYIGIKKRPVKIKQR